jgi:hypothetical protein
MRSFTLLLTAAATVVLAFPATKPGSSSSQYHNFSLSCTAVDLFHNFFLGATCCRPSDGAVEIQSQNELDLTMCIGLDQKSGRMQWEV